MRYCELADEVSKMTGVPTTICSQIWVKTLEVLKNDFASIEGIPQTTNQKKLYEFFKGKRIGMRFGPFRLCMNTYVLIRHAGIVNKIRRLKNAKHKEN